MYLHRSGRSSSHLPYVAKPTAFSAYHSRLLGPRRLVKVEARHDEADRESRVGIRLRPANGGRVAQRRGYRIVKFAARLKSGESCCARLDLEAAVADEQAAAQT